MGPTGTVTVSYAAMAAQIEDSFVSTWTSTEALDADSLRAGWQVRLNLRLSLSLSLSLSLRFRGIFILLVSCFMWSGALDSYSVHLQYSITSLSSHITIILISTLF